MEFDKFHACLELLDAIRTCFYALRFYVPTDEDPRALIYDYLDMIRNFVGGN